MTYNLYMYFMLYDSHTPCKYFDITYNHMYLCNMIVYYVSTLIYNITICILCYMIVILNGNTLMTLSSCTEPSWILSVYSCLYYTYY